MMSQEGPLEEANKSNELELEAGGEGRSVTKGFVTLLATTSLSPKNKKKKPKNQKENRENKEAKTLSKTHVHPCLGACQSG